MIVHRDCRHFAGDRPCRPHKETGVHCERCDCYDPVTGRIVIIKLDAVGDVLRTTCILPSLKEKFPSAEITWVTLSGAHEVFHANPYVDRVLSYEDPGTRLVLAAEKFTLLINLDSNERSASLASLCDAEEKLGYGLSVSGEVRCFNPEAETWFSMGLFDDIKKQNTRTYQSLMLEICRLPEMNFDIQLHLDPKEKERAAIFRRHHRIKPSDVVVGINAGASPRWEQKKWTIAGFRGLLRKLVGKRNYRVVLYGGKHERELNRKLRAGFSSRVIVVQTDDSLRDYFSLLNASDVVVTGDTLALHAATALGKQVVAMFGPTSAAEIHTYDRVQKVVSDQMECQCYYQPVCTQLTNCMNTISADRIFALVQEAAGKLSRRGARRA